MYIKWWELLDRDFISLSSTDQKNLYDSFYRYAYRELLHYLNDRSKGHIVEILFRRDAA